MDLSYRAMKEYKNRNWNRENHWGILSNHWDILITIGLISLGVIAICMFMAGIAN